MSVASKNHGANINLITKSGIESIEPVSGMVQLTGIVIEIEKANRI